mmetsp:Transcript_22119/g.49934  ORF Transcript_22119/g.49934 Transcript_22119/m.49934 type:complete len:265 (-) Transcript_22119:1258-2052(-)
MVALAGAAINDSAMLSSVRGGERCPAGLWCPTPPPLPATACSSPVSAPGGSGGGDCSEAGASSRAAGLAMTTRGCRLREDPLAASRRVAGDALERMLFHAVALLTGACTRAHRLVAARKRSFESRSGQAVRKSSRVSTITITNDFVMTECGGTLSLIIESSPKQSWSTSVPTIASPSMTKSSPRETKYIAELGCPCRRATVSGERVSEDRRRRTSRTARLSSERKMGDFLISSRLRTIARRIESCCGRSLKSRRFSVDCELRKM